MNQDIIKAVNLFMKACFHERIRMGKEVKITLSDTAKRKFGLNGVDEIINSFGKCKI
jgi:hypothetical protein